MARQVVSYDDLDAPMQSSSAPGISTAAVASIGATSSTADGITGRGTIGTVDITNTAHFISKDVDAIAAPVQNSNISRTSLDSSSSKKRKRDAQPQVNKGNAGKKQKNRGKQGNKTQGKRANGNGTGNVLMVSSSQLVQHWDDPGAEVDGLAYDDGEARAGETIEGTIHGDNEGNGAEQTSMDEGWETDLGHEDNLIADEDEDEEDESRDLTHEEIWDDSVLVAAWDAANEEYEALHGKNKHWKKDRVHKSPLWYNVPPEPQTKGKKKPKAKSAPGPGHGIASRDLFAQQSKAAVDSIPLDFHTFVPTHDASLSSSTLGAAPSLPQPTIASSSNVTGQYMSSFGPGVLPGPPSENAQASSNVNAHVIGADADVAFSRALDAMYWCGYWTAVYHTQRSKEKGAEGANGVLTDEGAGEEAEEDDELLVSTQR